MFSFTMFMSLCVDVMVMSSAYVVSFTGACGAVVSDVRVDTVDDRTSPCGITVLKWRCIDVVEYSFLEQIYPLSFLFFFCTYVYVSYVL